METHFISSQDLSEFGLDPSHLSKLGDRTLVVTRWNWDYQLSHQFQKYCVEQIQSWPGHRVLICCSHPETLTHGRGLQKPRKGEELGLKEFRADNYPRLPYPLFQIERGGGLTFHHPGQFIFYPILKLHPDRLSLSQLIHQIFAFSSEVLAGWKIRNLNHESKLLGLWAGERKLASMGIAIQKLTTFHGMALNIKKNESMLSALRDLSPCGLSPQTYVCAEELGDLPPDPHEDFRQRILERIKHEWK
ncbi:MAG TPA: hypothetical protein VNJ01_06140 [Bacteriovoracaceae bacterium]|nr:hypothetical protein [Bacteriovoracaceae bacterium]